MHTDPLTRTVIDSKHGHSRQADKKAPTSASRWTPRRLPRLPWRRNHRSLKPPPHAGRIPLYALTPRSDPKRRESPGPGAALAPRGHQAKAPAGDGAGLHARRDHRPSPADATAGLSAGNHRWDPGSGRPEPPDHRRPLPRPEAVPARPIG